MANIVRFEPMREMVRMSDAMDRLFNNIYGGRMRNNELFDSPSVDLYQTENEIVVKASPARYKSRRHSDLCCGRCVDPSRRDYVGRRGQGSVISHSRTPQRKFCPVNAITGGCPG